MNGDVPDIVTQVRSSQKLINSHQVKSKEPLSSLNENVDTRHMQTQINMEAHFVLIESNLKQLCTLGQYIRDELEKCEVM